MEPSKITDLTSTYVIMQSTRFGINTMGIVELTTNQYLTYSRKTYRLNRAVDGKAPNIQISIIPTEELTIQTLDNILKFSEEVNRMEVYRTNTEKVTEAYLEMLEDYLYERDRKQE